MTTPNLTLSTNEEVETVEEVTPEVAVISEVKTYTDGEGRTVIGQIPVSMPEATTSYEGAFMVQTNMGPVRLRIEFPEGNTIEDCFAQFDVLAQETVEQAQKEAQEEALERNRIVTPDGKPTMTLA